MASKQEVLEHVLEHLKKLATIFQNKAKSQPDTQTLLACYLDGLEDTLNAVYLSGDISFTIRDEVERLFDEFE